MHAKNDDTIMAVTVLIESIKRNIEKILRENESNCKAKIVNDKWKEMIIFVIKVIFSHQCNRLCKKRASSMLTTSVGFDQK